MSFFTIFGMSSVIQTAAPAFIADTTKNRVRHIENRLAEICNPFLWPSSALLTSICELDTSRFTHDKYRWLRVSKSVQAMLLQDGFEAIISVKKIGQSNKSAYRALRIFLPLDKTKAPQVDCVFRSTQKFDERAFNEACLRWKCNSLRNFPKLLASGYYLGRKKKSACEKIMMIEEYHPETLKTYVEAHPEILSCPSQSIPLLCSLLEALEDLHRTHVHVDLKVDNLLISVEKKLLLTDFGIADTVDSEVAFPNVTAYMSPEIFDFAQYEASDGELWFSLKPSYDMWEFGMIAYSLLHQVIGMEPVPSFTGKHSSLITRYPKMDDLFYKIEYDRYKSSIATFTGLLESGSHPLAKWLAGILKLNPSERSTASEALVWLEKYAKDSIGVYG